MKKLLESITKKILTENNRLNKYGLAFNITEKGIEFVSNQDGREWVQSIIDDKGILDAEAHIIEYSGLLGNGGNYINPEDIGALTDATIILYDGKLYSDINYYQITSFAEKLSNNEETILFDTGETISSEEEVRIFGE